MTTCNWNDYILEITKTISRSNMLDYDYAEGKRFPSVNYINIHVMDKKCKFSIFDFRFDNRFVYDIMFALARFSTNEDIKKANVITEGTAFTGLQLNDDLLTQLNFNICKDEYNEVCITFSFLNKRMNETVYFQFTTVQEEELQELYYALRDECK